MKSPLNSKKSLIKGLWMSRGDAWCRPPSQQSRLDGALSSIIHPSDLLNPNGLESQYSSLSQKLIERFNAST
jgi:hypothetical protein